MTTLSQLKTFITVAEQGGFTAASRRLGLTQPAVSRTIATLEKELGLPLFVRRREGLVLTEAGSVALAHAREAVHHLTLMHTEVAGLAGDITGTLYLASIPTATATLVAPQLQTFAQRHPAVSIRLLEGSEEEVRDWLDQGAAEAGVVRLPIKGLEVAALGDQEMVAVVPASSRLASKDTITYPELAEEPFVRGHGGCADVFMPIARQAGVAFDVAFDAREIAAALEIVRAGLGVSILPRAGLPDVPGVAVRALIPKTVRHLGIAISASASAAARAFLEQIAVQSGGVGLIEPMK
ncbi:LysR family transcriptional regulator [Mycobacterium shimoidei]|uniref:Probable hydrogen peroxide-inducible genes activator n=1 Tax=Mycobacterium shimoidei TaxID=29313 RepID=A0A1E3TLT7_MYCSH|nr:LysR family transcriptional regulator [Mycobacterium shimoidei]MCV7258735.1 LysR family transcriptional regulator [Mycobacterium shimoidei]ODR15351.1 LysR family transcriptional regulator [Mycobacterium shimoidei]ORW79930.1 LysR family transcriptional regulator [Mycobacterium shimoidei]SRX92797.1 LysR family transcriptional regulator [Pseudonocardia dioxanivorans] [Mycobacterium shimoidei]